MATLGDLVVKLSMDAAGFASDAGRAAYAAEKSMARVAAAANVAAEAVVAIGAAAVAAAPVLAAALVHVASSVAEQADALQEAADAAGLAAEQYQQLQLAMSLGGVSSEQFASGMAKLNAAMVDAANDNGKAADAFKALGVNVLDANGALKDAGAVMLELSESLRKTGVTATQIANIKDIFGKAGFQFIPGLLSNLDALNAKLRESGAIIDADLRFQAQELETAMAGIGIEAQALKNHIASSLLPAMTATADAFALIASEATKAGVEIGIFEELSTLSDEIGVRFAFWAGALADVFRLIGNLVKALVDFIQLLQRAAEGLNRLLAFDTEGAKQAFAEVKREAAELVDDLARMVDQPIAIKAVVKFDQASKDRAVREMANQFTTLQSSVDKFIAAQKPFEPEEKKSKKTRTKAPSQDFLEDLQKLARMQEQDEKEAAQARIKHDTEASEERIKLAEKEAERIEDLRKKTAEFQLKIDMEVYEEEQKETEKQLDELGKMYDQMADDRQRINERLSDDLVGPLLDFVDGTKTASDAFTDFIGNVTRSLQQMAAQGLAEQIFGDLFNKEGGGAGGFIQNLFGSGGGGGGGASSLLDMEDLIEFGGGYQHGGIFTGNKMIRVGERGPEFIHAMTGGRVEPIEQSKQTTNNVSVNVSVPPSTDRRTADQIAAQVGVAVGRAMRRIQ